MKILALAVILISLSACATTPKYSEQECRAKVSALEAKASAAWSEAGSDKTAMARAAEVAADSAKQAADLDNGPCKSPSKHSEGRALKL